MRLAGKEAGTSLRDSTLYYQAEVQIQQREPKPASTILTEAAQLAKSLGSRLYFNKLAAGYHQLEEQWPKEPLVQHQVEKGRVRNWSEPQNLLLARPLLCGEGFTEYSFLVGAVT